MNDDDLARRIVARLDHGLAELPARIAQRLQAARTAALAQRPDAGASSGWRRAGRLLQDWGMGRSLTTRLVLPVALVIASVTGLIYWQTASHHEEEFDAGMLAGELPIHAYIDPGFDAWLTHTSHTQPQR